MWCRPSLYVSVCICALGCVRLCIGYPCEFIHVGLYVPVSVGYVCMHKGSDHCFLPSIHTYIHAYIHTYIHTYINTYIHTYCTYIQIYIYTYIHTHIYTYIHTVHTHMHTSIYIYIYHFVRNNNNDNLNGYSYWTWHRGIPGDT